MQNIKAFNLLIIGRSGSGKSATTKLLTSNPSVRVANSLKEVTTEVDFYEGTSFFVAGQEVRFRILDIPGLDKINSRLDIRQKILMKLQSQNVILHAIIYVSSLTQRDTIDQNKLFEFLEQLPWSHQDKKNALIPIFTKYDNLVIDSQEEDVLSTKKEFQQIFQKLNYACAWSKRIYWINHTKSLQFKIKSYEEIREKYEKQIERLILMLKKNKAFLTAKAIRQTMQEQNKYLLKELFCQLQKNTIPFHYDVKHISILLKIQVEPQNIQQSVTAVSASSIGIFISRVCKKQISTHFSILLMGVPIAIALLKLATASFVCHQKKIGQNSSGQTIMQSYEHICKEINSEMEKQWREINQSLEFYAIDNFLCCRITKIKPYKFFNLDNLALCFENKPFQGVFQEGKRIYKLKIPKFSQQTVWNPQIIVQYKIKRYSEESVLKIIEQERKKFCLKI